MTRRVIVVLVLAILAAIAGRFDGARRAAALATPRPAATQPFPLGADGDASRQRSVVDMYGNEIEPAVGDYRIDPRGGIYERHAPDTAVAALGPPSS